MIPSSILRTKVEPPGPPRHPVARSRLQLALEQSVVHHRLTLVCAPAGYGKTTLLADWARTSRLPVAWVSLAAEDDAVERFLRGLVAAWETVQPGIVESAVGLLLGSSEPDLQAVLPAFAQAGEQSPHPVAFVLDDYHHLHHPDVHTAFGSILDRLPPQLHFVVASRGEPPLALARYRARGQLFELRAADLRFSPDECQDFLRQASVVPLSPSEAAALHAGTEGWIAGLQLASLALRQRMPGGQPLPPISGRQRFIADYLAEDVFDQLPPDRQMFLLQTSLLDRLCGPLCDMVVGAQGGQAMLEALERDNLFLLPLDDRREWYRYHPLFAEFLQEALHRRHPGRAASLHRSAAQWYLAHDLADPAFRHAVAAEAADLAVRIVERHFAAKLMGGDYSTLNRWLALLPGQWRADYPQFGFVQAAVLLFTGDLETSARCVDAIEARLAQARRSDAPQQQARVTALRCFMACFRQDLPLAEGYADEALRALAPDDLAFRADTYHALADTYRSHGRWETARAYYRRALALDQAPAHEIRSVHVNGGLADLELRQGHLRSSAAYWRRALDAIREPEAWGSFPLPLTGWVYIRLGEILYEWNDLAAAGEHVARGLARAELGGDVRALIAGRLLSGRLKLAAGDVPAAAEQLERARPLIENAAFPDWQNRFDQFQVDLWLAQGQRRAALAWAQASLKSGSLLARPESEGAGLALARALIVSGDLPAIARALDGLVSLAQAAGAVGRMGLQVEALALQALAQSLRGEQAAALTLLEQALRLAEPEGYLRLFVDLGSPLARLLQVARDRQVMSAYVGALLAAFDETASLAGADPLPEPLSAREREVLALLAAGLTNRQIAASLFISPETAKKHTAAIYGKLGVNNRTQAAARAREMGLLG
jgi:LuxR family maltose regulon positive regulatory protein